MDKRKYEGDVAAAVYMNGGNPDLIDPDRLKSYYDGGLYHEDAATEEMRYQVKPKERGPNELWGG